MNEEVNSLNELDSNSSPNFLCWSYKKYQNPGQQCGNRAKLRNAKIKASTLCEYYNNRRI